MWYYLLLLIVLVIIAIVLYRLWPTSGGSCCSGGDERFPTIHISGPSGAGKTTLGHLIKKQHPNYLVFDVDDITGPIAKKLLSGSRKSDSYIESHYIKQVETAVNEILARESKRAPVVMVGYMDWGNIHQVKTPHVRFDYKFFIDVPDDTLVNQRWKRDIQDELCNKICHPAVDYATKPVVDVLFSPERILQHKRTLSKQYRHLKYEFMTSDQILKALKSIT